MNRSLALARRSLAGLFAAIYDSPAFVLTRDFRLFLVGARTDAALRRARAVSGAPAAFQAAYVASSDPWASASSRFRYQQRKYEQIIALLPRDRRFRNTLDLGCGLGLLSQRLAARSDQVLGIDLAPAALVQARSRAVGIANLRFDEGDVLDLPSHMDGCFDLIVVADILYYLAPLNDGVLAALSARLAALLAPGGVCLLVNHYFFALDQDSRVSKRIHTVIGSSPMLRVVGEHRRAFFIATLLMR